jgi:hypothetical protein
MYGLKPVPFHLRLLRCGADESLPSAAKAAVNFTIYVRAEARILSICGCGEDESLPSAAKAAVNFHDLCTG